MTTRPTPRRRLTAPPPRWLRPKLTRDQVLDLHLLHISILDDIRSGRAGETTLWELVAMVFTWSRVAQLLAVGEPEMAGQLALATTLVERFAATGQVHYQGLEYGIARVGSIVMDLLAELADVHTATEASHWSEAQVHAIRAAQTLVAA